MFWILEGNEGAPNPGRLALPVRLRNLLIAPITEEWVFRGCMVGMLKLEGWEDGQTTFAAPLFFGVAHIHHIYQLVLHQSYTVVEAVLEVLFQVLYTTAFGWYAVFVLLHTKSLPACVLCHCACNLLGLPILPEMIQHERKRFWLVTTAIGIISFFSSLSPLGELCKVTKDIW
ncbi:unnamed protein product [Ostreobium quekettii]|uniref:intramembrane prenyl-peptidase Rce1 n=1 Tax=Ostreobium quekettii TaxID=121088 RepID=A0A8S1J5E4_9CHLO|nr:unnamed protein product [Ostreobium quekettii]